MMIRRGILGCLCALMLSTSHGMMKEDEFFKNKPYQKEEGEETQSPTMKLMYLEAQTLGLLLKETAQELKKESGGIYIFDNVSFDNPFIKIKDMFHSKEFEYIRLGNGILKPLINKEGLHFDHIQRSREGALSQLVMTFPFVDATIPNDIKKLNEDISLFLGNISNYIHIYISSFHDYYVDTDKKSALMKVLTNAYITQQYEADPIAHADLSVARLMKGYEEKNEKRRELFSWKTSYLMEDLSYKLNNKDKFLENDLDVLKALCILPKRLFDFLNEHTVLTAEDIDHICFEDMKELLSKKIIQNVVSFEDILSFDKNIGNYKRHQEISSEKMGSLATLYHRLGVGHQIRCRDLYRSAPEGTMEEYYNELKKNLKVNLLMKNKKKSEEV